MLCALRLHEPSTGRTWLSFPSAPPAELRAQLVAAGWRFHRAQRAWWHEAGPAAVPAGLMLGRGGVCRYSEPQEHLTLADALRRMALRRAA